MSLDTDPHIAQMQTELLRAAGPGKRLDLAVQLSAMTWNMARSAVDRYYPEETQDQRDLRFLSSVYGRELAEKFIAHRQRVLGPRNETLKPPTPGECP